MTEPDLAHVRSRFPALARELDGRPAVFVDAPGGSQVPEPVIEAMAAYLRRSNANAHGAFATSQDTDHVIEEAHRAAADLLNADADEVVFGPNATTLLFAISRSIARSLGPGDEVVVTRLDHDANVRPWVLAAEDAGATVRWTSRISRRFAIAFHPWRAPAPTVARASSPMRRAAPRCPNL